MVEEIYADYGDPEELEERKIKERHLKAYGLPALEVGAAVDAVKVLFPQFRQALEACDRIYELGKALDIPQGMVVTGPPGSSKTTLATYFIRSLPSVPTGVVVAESLVAPGDGAQRAHSETFVPEQR